MMEGWPYAKSLFKAFVFKQTGSAYQKRTMLGELMVCDVLEEG